MTTMTAFPRVWIGCLGCYSAGDLVGEWVDATEADEFTQTFNSNLFPDPLNVPAVQPAPTAHLVDCHEEWWVMAFEGFGGFLTEECSPSRAQQIAEMMTAVVGDGKEVDAVSAWAKIRDEPVIEWDKPTRDEFDSDYIGRYESFHHYAEEALHERLEFEEIPEWLHDLVDVDAFARTHLLFNCSTVDLIGHEGEIAAVYIFNRQ